jgi:ATP-dependent RNA helicase HelY
VGHARWAERAWRRRAETAALQGRMDSRTNSIARQFDRICGVLASLGYLTDDGPDPGVTGAGRQLSRIYGESDLLALQCLRAGLWDGLGPADLAAAVSLLVYESRGADLPGAAPARVPGSLREVVDRTGRLWADLEDLEKRSGLQPTRQPEAGFAWALHRWASGATLRTVLEGSDLTAGDFVRWCKQVMDFLGQLATATPDDGLARTARDAIDALRRGVVSVALP